MTEPLSSLGRPSAPMINDDPNEAEARPNGAEEPRTEEPRAASAQLQKALDLVGVAQGKLEAYDRDRERRSYRAHSSVSETQVVLQQLAALLAQALSERLRADLHDVALGGSRPPLATETVAVGRPSAKKLFRETTEYLSPLDDGLRVNRPIQTEKVEVGRPSALDVQFEEIVRKGCLNCRGTGIVPRTWTFGKSEQVDVPTACSECERVAEKVREAIRLALASSPHLPSWCGACCFVHDPADGCVEAALKSHVARLQADLAEANARLSAADPPSEPTP